VGRSEARQRLLLETKKSFDQRHRPETDREEIRDLIVRAFDRLLTAGNELNFYWGSRWVNRSFDDLEQAYYLLDTARRE